VEWSDPPLPRIRSVEETVITALSECSPRRVAIDGRLSNPAFHPGAIPKTTEAHLRNAFASKLRTAYRIFAWGPFSRWARLAFDAGRRLHDRKPIDVIWAIHGDDSCHEIAFRLHCKFHKPWIADYKDPWDAFHSGLARPLQRIATRHRLATACTITETCAAQADADRRLFGKTTKVIYSGYDPGPMACATPQKLGCGDLSMAYLGNLDSTHDLHLLPEILRELRQRGSLGPMRLVFHHFGLPEGQFRAIFDEAGFPDNVHEHGLVVPNEAFSVMRGADVLLLLVPRKFAIGVKELEYFASGTPVMILGEPLADMKEIIRDLSQVIIIRTASEGADFLEREFAYLGQQGNSPTRGCVNSPALTRFSWQQQAFRLADVLHGAVFNQ